MKAMVARLTIMCISLIVLGLMSTGQSDAKIDWETAVGIWTFDDGKGDIAEDSSGKGNDAKIIGAKWTEGKFGKALEFDGVDDYVDCGSDESLNPTDAITVVAWIKSTPASYNAPWSVVSKYNAYILGPPDSNTKRMCFIIHNGGWQYDSCYTPGDVTAWHHYAGTYDKKSTEKNLYADGKLSETTKPGGAITADTGPLHIAHREGVALNQDHFKGLIDDVAIFNVVLSKDDINQIMTKGFTTAVSPKEKLTTTWSSIKKQ